MMFSFAMPGREVDLWGFTAKCSINVWIEFGESESPWKRDYVTGSRDSHPDAGQPGFSC